MNNHTDYIEIQRNIWAKPLTDNEEKLIRQALEGDNPVTIKQWCKHLLEIAVAQRSKHE